MRIRASTIRMKCITMDFDEVVKRRKIREYDMDRQQIQMK